MGRFYFIYGAAGSGKTTYLYNTLTKRAVEEPDRRFFLFVPEQNTLKAQQELIRHSEVHGMLNLDVLSFSLLGYRVMEELGIRAPEVLDDISKSLLMRKALGEVKKDLSVYSGKLESPGFVRELLSALSEFSQYGVKSGDLRKTSEEAGTPLLKGKLSDIEKILSAFYRLLEADPARTIPEELPGILLKNLRKSEILSGAVICFDGFTGFTPVQLSLIEEIAEKCDSVSFAVTIPKEEMERAGGHFTDLFYLSRETVKNLVDTCTRAGLRRGEDIGPQREAVYEGPLQIRKGTDVSVYALADPTEEIRFIASDIEKKTKREGIRYRKTVVAVSDLPMYREIIKREFAGGKIPFFIDDKMPAAGSPVVELIRSAVLLVKNGYEYEDLMTYLRNPYVTEKTERDRLDLFENFLLATGIRGKKNCQEPFDERKYIPEIFLKKIGEIEAFRKSHLTAVFLLHEKLKEGESAEEKAKALLSFLEEVFLSDEALSDDEKRFLTLSRELLERTVSLFADSRMSIREFAELIEAGFLDMKAGTVPATMDMVSVGDLKRSRFDDIDCLYIAGANEGLIPQSTTGGGLFTDAERMELLEKNLPLAPDDRHDASIQNFYLYLCMNKPSKNLVITLSARDRSGAAQKPSVILREMELRVPGRQYGVGEAGLLQTLSGMLPDYFEAAGAEKKKSIAREIRALLSVLLSSENPETVQKTELILSAAAKSRILEKLSPETARSLYGDHLSGSVTRFENFARCPYSHFVDYGLCLKERETYDVERYDIGRLYHSAIDTVFKELKDKGRDLKTVPEEELLSLSGTVARRVCTDYNGDLLSGSARNRYIASCVERITKKTMSVLRRHAAGGSFETKGTEKKFRISDLGYALSGSIDRLDVCEKDGKDYVKIIDYKTGKKFDLARCYAGLDLQLAAYMREALSEEEQNGKAASPAGMFIYNVADPVLPYGEKNEKAFRMNGLLVDDPGVVSLIDGEIFPDGTSRVIPAKVKNGAVSEDAANKSAMVPEETFRALLRRNKELMREDAAEILSGKIEAKPFSYEERTGCDYCSYRGICAFDKKTGSAFRKVPELSKKDVIGLLQDQVCRR